MRVLSQVLSEARIAQPDGRPLYAFPIAPDAHSQLGQLLRPRVACGDVLRSTAAGFVLWSAEYIRAQFKGGPLTWEFVFQGLGLRENRELAIQLVELGLAWWQRPLRRDEGRRRRFLYSLMAEGGLPEALLVQTGQYQRVVKGLLAEIEAEGSNVPDAVTYRIAGRWIQELPLTFRSDDVAELLAELAREVARLRAEVPANVPVEMIDCWLDSHSTDWVKRLPLRMSPEVAEQLIRPTLRTEREATVATGPLAQRVLRRDATGGWRPIATLAEQGVVLQAMLPDADGLRLRLLPSGAATERIGAIAYSATPGGPGWLLRRIGGAGTSVPLPHDLPFVLAAFADGRPVGEIEILPVLSSPEEGPSVWRASDPAEAEAATELLPLSGRASTRARCLWVLAATSTSPIASDGLTLAAPEQADGGTLWRVTGSGEIRFDDWIVQVDTGAEIEAPDARLLAFGDVVPGWRLAGSAGLVFRGEPRLAGQIGAGELLPVPRTRIRVRPARRLGAHIAEWVDRDTVLARLRYVTLPGEAQLTLRETGPGALELAAEGLPPGLTARMSAGNTEARAELATGAGRIALAVAGAPPGLVSLRLASPATGDALELVAAWPARRGMILSPEGVRLERDLPISADALRGWRAILPEGSIGDLQLQLTGQSPVALRFAGEVALTAHLPLIRSMLAQGGPDAQVKLRLVVEGEEGPRLEARRYQEHAETKDGHLWTGLLIGGARGEKTTPVATRGKVEIHAIDLGVNQHVVSAAREGEPDVDLRTVLPEGGPWLIQAKRQGRVQRAVVWTPDPSPPSSREARIAAYAEEWARLIAASDDQDWTRAWNLIRAANAGGDAGILDQVQALAKVPAAAVALALRAPQKEIAEALSLDLAAPIFWPALPVTAFDSALASERSRRRTAYAQVGLEGARDEADAALARQIGVILTLHPELRMHFCLAMQHIVMPPFAFFPHASGVPSPLREEAPAARLVERALECVRRFDWLPSGVAGLEPRRRPNGLSFNPHVQPVIDAPLVVAEIAAGQRPPPDTALTLTLINLRLVDPSYFDAALPVALAIVNQEARS